MIPMEGKTMATQATYGYICVDEATMQRQGEIRLCDSVCGIVHRDERVARDHAARHGHEVVWVDESGRSENH